MTTSLTLTKSKKTSEKPNESAEEKSGSQTLAYKRSILNGLVTTMQMLSRPLAISEQEKIEALEYAQKVQTQRLLEECQHREIDIKIDNMRKVITILKNNTFSL